MDDLAPGQEIVHLATYIGLCLLSTPYVARWTISCPGASVRNARSVAGVPTKVRARAPKIRWIAATSACEPGSAAARGASARTPPLWGGAGRSRRRSQTEAEGTYSMT